MERSESIGYDGLEVSSHLTQMFLGKPIVHRRIRDPGLNCFSLGLLYSDNFNQSLTYMLSLSESQENIKMLLFVMIISINIFVNLRGILAPSRSDIKLHKCLSSAYILSVILSWKCSLLSLSVCLSAFHSLCVITVMLSSAPRAPLATSHCS